MATIGLAELLILGVIAFVCLAGVAGLGLGLFFALRKPKQ